MSSSSLDVEDEPSAAPEARVVPAFEGKSVAMDKLSYPLTVVKTINLTQDGGPALSTRLKVASPRSRMKHRNSRSL